MVRNRIVICKLFMELLTIVFLLEFLVLIVIFNCHLIDVLIVIILNHIYEWIIGFGDYRYRWIIDIFTKVADVIKLACANLHLTLFSLYLRYASGMSSMLTFKIVAHWRQKFLNVFFFCIAMQEISQKQNLYVWCILTNLLRKQP